jgi:hypothetical protein
MAGSKAFTPESITPGEFGELLDHYAPLIESISASKGGKSGLNCEERNSAGNCILFYFFFFF